MIEDFDFSLLAEPVTEWYKENRRSLPWREDRDPYHIWVSEIMLQQTRVEAVIPYYLRFMRELPDVAALAACPQERLLKLWEGLGYYSRARHMQEAALRITEEFGGAMPSDPQEILSLPGIGPYTAGAVASIAFGRRTPAVDGNVLRVVSRVSGDDSDIKCDSTRKKVVRALTPVMPSDPGTFNQALMELGALLCVPNGAPRCEECPWASFCRARAEGRTAELPVRAKAKRRRIEKRTVLIVRDGEKILLHKRPERGLLAGLYELPNLDGQRTQEEALEFVRSHDLAPLRITELPGARHVFSHVEWEMTGYMVRVADTESFREAGPSDPGYLLVEARTAARDYAIPSAFAAYVGYVNISLGIH